MTENNDAGAGPTNRVAPKRGRVAIRGADVDRAAGR